VAIRPTDIQGSIWQASQTAPLTQRGEEAPRAAQAAAQATFAGEVERRQETVAETGEVEGGIIDANAERRHDPGERRDRERRASYDERAEALDETPHVIDVTA
jgi:hypothetical protein